MTEVVFYEKRGCVNNARQKALLQALGHEVRARDLLTEAWTTTRLAAFFVGRPVSAWFNESAPRVKSGEVLPGRVDAGQALCLMMADPLLIRRPLLETPFGCAAGFDDNPVTRELGVGSADSADLQGCARPAAAGCPPPGAPR